MSVKKNEQGLEMAHWLKGLMHRHEEARVQTSITNTEWASQTMLTSMRSRDGIPRVSWLAKLAVLMSSGFN